MKLYMYKPRTYKQDFTLYQMFLPVFVLFDIYNFIDSCNSHHHPVLCKVLELIQCLYVHHITTANTICQSWCQDQLVRGQLKAHVLFSASYSANLVKPCFQFQLGVVKSSWSLTRLYDKKGQEVNNTNNTSDVYWIDTSVTAKPLMCRIANASNRLVFRILVVLLGTVC